MGHEEGSSSSAAGSSSGERERHLSNTGHVSFDGCLRHNYRRAEVEKGRIDYRLPFHLSGEQEDSEKHGQKSAVGVRKD